MNLIDVNNICEHELFKQLKLPTDENCQNILSYRSDYLFVWDENCCSVHVIDVKKCTRDKDLTNETILQVTPKLLFTVNTLEPNASCSYLSLSGKNGVVIVQLPELFIKMSKTNVDYLSIGQRLFLGEQYTLRQMKWHPGSPSDSHIVVLTSDECLRCYDVTNGTVLWKCVLSNSSNTQSNIPNKISLGDVPIGFDFAPPPFNEDLLQIKWPILVLWGHGDVYCVISSLSHEKVSVEGPLRMFPSSDDNYGTDASSLIVLSSSPPVVVISTFTGTLYHSLLMSAEEPEHKNDKSLYVIESVELDLGLSVMEEDGLLTSQISLMRDPVEPSRYFCIHDGGVHSVTFPLIAKLHHFLSENETEFSRYTSNSLVEYLVCTGINSENKFDVLPIVGCSFLDLSMTLLVLTPEGPLLNIKLLPKTIHSTQTLAAGEEETENDRGFVLMVENLLKETIPPLMKLPSTNVDTWYELVMRTSQQCRAIMKTHESIANQMTERAVEIKAAVMTQWEQVEKLSNEKATLTENAEKIAERYEELNEKQNGLMERVEGILKISNSQETSLTPKEKEAYEYIASLKDSISKYQSDLHRVKKTHSYQMSVCRDEDDKRDNKGFYLDDNRTRALKKHFSDLHAEIFLLIKKLKDIQTAIQEVKSYS